jgi:hypothetical protein
MIRRNADLLNEMSAPEQSKAPKESAVSVDAEKNRFNTSLQA